MDGLRIGKDGISFEIHDFEFDFSENSDLIARHKDTGTEYVFNKSGVAVEDKDVARKRDIGPEIESHRENDVHDQAQPPQEHGGEAHNSDDLHDKAVGVPTYSSMSNVPVIPEGHAVVVDGDLYIENGE